MNHAEMRKIKEIILHEKRIYIKDAAQIIGYSAPHLYNVLNGKISPGKKLISKLREFTKKAKK